MPVREGKGSCGVGRSPRVTMRVSKSVRLGLGGGRETACRMCRDRLPSPVPTPHSPHCQLPKAGRTETVRPRTWR